MEYRIAYDPDEKLLVQAARLHQQALSFTSFLTSFGEEFLVQLYKALIELRLGFFVLASEPPALRGFIFGSTDSSRLMGVVARRFYVFLPIMLPAFVRQPSLIIKAFNILFYSQKTAAIPIKSELVVIAVESGERSRGIGAALVERLDEEFRNKGVDRYKVTVHGHMDRANNFYRKTGFSFEGAFKLAGMDWNIYTKSTAAR